MPLGCVPNEIIRNVCGGHFQSRAYWTWAAKKGEVSEATQREDPYATRYNEGEAGRQDKERIPGATDRIYSFVPHDGDADIEESYALHGLGGGIAHGAERKSRL